MNKTWLAALILSICVWPMPAWAQPAPEPYVNHGKFFRHVIETKDFQDEMPLAKFLQALEKRLPKKEKISLRIDAEAFGDKFAEVAATPVRLPAHPRKMNLGIALRLARAKIVTDSDYRLGPSEFVITTPKRALYTAVHEMLNIKPDRVIKVLLEDEFSADLATIQVLNEKRLMIRANEKMHNYANYLVDTFRSLDDMQVIVTARLYEADDAFYQKLKNMKPISLEEEEKLLLAGKPSPWDPLLKLLPKQKQVLRGDEIKVGDGEKAVLLSRHKVMTCLRSPEQFRKGEDGRQRVLLGFSFIGKFQISADRRFLRVKLKEEVTELQELKKVMASLPGVSEQKLVAEIPFLSVTTHTRVLEIADGGTILVPVQVRTPDLGKDRFWVLAITPRIWIGEEERTIEKGALSELLPVVAADILKNPRLKNLRQFYGTPGDQRFALVNSPAWTWTKEDRPDVAGFQLAPGQRTGKRLLGIRIDQYQAGKNGDYTITASLVNAGGSDNGPVIGGGTIRYSARSTDKGWRVELAEKLEP
jgi:hypothetical protein